MPYNQPSQPAVPSPQQSTSNPLPAANSSITSRQAAARKTTLSMLVTTVRNKRVERILDRVQRQRERSHRRNRDRLFLHARQIAFSQSGTPASA